MLVKGAIGDKYKRPHKGSDMVCHFSSAKPLPEPIYCQLDPRGQIQVKFESKYEKFPSRKYTWNEDVDFENTAYT